ncbi:WAT1-related protein [Cucumis melo var. makuwa]|uniref:WAT1-related protein n=1 Tax=Cucumis melo var. makuwa TaxID=1194695 RepID=A0A5D3CKH0_CUCMM|nr:WAT1-related protein [Cucumis melo var. makuwa]
MTSIQHKELGRYRWFENRMEKLKVKKASGMAKVGGLILCVVGVSILAFYKGPLMKPLFNYHLLETQHHNSHPSNSSPQHTWALGCFMLLISSISSGLWLVLQALVLKEACPSPLVLTCGQTLSSTFQTFVVAIAVESNPSEWKLGWNIRLFSVLYCGIFVICIGNYLTCWVLKKKGPVFIAATTPLNLIATLIGSQFLLSDGTSLGSLIGGILLVLSLYSVLWGQSKENDHENTQINLNINPIPPEKEIGDLHDINQISSSKS